jgi:hypothetical protein
VLTAHAFAHLGLAVPGGLAGRQASCSRTAAMAERWPDLAGRIEGGTHVLPVRVYYEDTDFSGSSITPIT